MSRSQFIIRKHNNYFSTAMADLLAQMGAWIPNEAIHYEAGELDVAVRSDGYIALLEFNSMHFNGNILSATDELLDFTGGSIETQHRHVHKNNASGTESHSIEVKADTSDM